MLSLLPPDKNQHEVHIRLADWVEINLVVGDEPIVSVTDLTAALTADPPDSADDSETRERFSDDAESQADDAFAELSQRAKWLAHSYPLTVAGDVATYRDDVKHPELWRFVTLLRARQLYHTSSLGDDSNETGYLFEELARIALGAYAGAQPDHSVRFGVAGGERGATLPLHLPGALTELSNRMHEQAGTLPTTNGRDYGADTVAWRAFGDRRPGQIVLIGQATVSERKWIDKEPQYRWTDSKTGADRPINFLSRPLTAVAFVETLSLISDETLHGLTKNFSSVPFDRLRLMSVLTEVDVPTAFYRRVAHWVESVRPRVPK